MENYMLDTAFNKKFSPVDRGRFLEAQTENWSYVGRFLWGFARIEYEINSGSMILLTLEPALGF